MLAVTENFGGWLNIVDVSVRVAQSQDLEAIRGIYNQGILDRIATLDAEPKSPDDMMIWWDAHRGRYGVLVAEIGHQVVGWASLNPYSSRQAYRGVAELSIYVHREHRGQHIGQQLLTQLEILARQHLFYKIVLFTFPHNMAGQRLYTKMGYREVGIFQRQGYLDGAFVDIMAMEKFIQTL